MPWDLDKLAEFQTEASYNEIILGHGFEVILSHDPLFSFVTPHSSYISPFFYFLFEFEKRYDAIDAFYYPREILVEDFDTLKNVHWALQTWSKASLSHPFLPHVTSQHPYISPTSFLCECKGTGREIPFIMFDFYNVDKPFSQDEPTFKKSALSG